MDGLTTLKAAVDNIIFRELFDIATFEIRPSYIDVKGTEVRVSETKVVGTQQSAIADSVVGDEVTKINEILAALRAHGIIAT